MWQLYIQTIKKNRKTNHRTGVIFVQWTHTNERVHYHCHNGHELSKLRHRAGQRRLECYSPWGLKGVGHSLATIQQLPLSTIMWMNIVSLFYFCQPFSSKFLNCAYKGLSNKESFKNISFYYSTIIDSIFNI